MGKIRQAVCAWAFLRDGLTVARLCREAKRIGYEGLEMVPDEHWDEVTEAGLALVSTQAHGTLTDGLNRRENHQRIEREVEATVARARRHGMPVLIAFSGNRNGLDDATGLEHTVEGLKRIAPIAERGGVTIALELLNSRVDHPDYQCDRTAWGAEAVRRVGSPRIKLLYDIYHMQIMEGDVIRTMREHIDLIGHVHTAGNPGRRDLDGEQELNYPAIMRVLSSSAYGGFVGQEFIPKGDPVAAMEAAYRTCDV